MFIIVYLVLDCAKNITESASSRNKINKDIHKSSIYLTGKKTKFKQT